MDTETPDLRRLFSACDVNRSGRIEFEDFSAVCRDLGVPAGDVGSLFRRFDGDADGSINFSDFSSRFHEVSETLDLASLGGSQRDAWQEFENTMDGDVAFYLPRLRDALGEMYQLIHSSSDLALLQQYEEFVQALVSEGRDHRLDSDQLETSLRRIEETTSNQLAELEEDLQLQLRRTEERVREEEQKRMEEMVAALQRKHDNEVTDLQAAVDRLYTYQEESELSSPKEDVSRLRNQMRELIQENDQLRSSLMKAQTNISVLQVELDKLKNAYTEQRLQHEQESDDLKNMVIEYQSYSNHIEILQEMNKKLYDSNDGLRSALASDMASSKRRLSPKIDSPARRMRPIRQSTLSHNRFASEEDGMDVNSSNSNYSHVASWADKYFDSGVALPMDVDGSMASGYDSDESRDSLETVHHSYSYVPSELETTDVKSEAEVSVAPSRVSSIASSIRRRLSAFPAKHAEADLLDSDGPSPMYRLVLAGDAGAGKSSFLLRLSLNEFKSDIQTTLGVDFQIKKMLVDGERTSLQIWDTAGQERFRSIARSYFRKAHGVLLLYDVTSESSFLNVREWMEQIQESTDGNIPTCVIGNKMDLRAERPEGSCVSPVHGEKLAMTYNALFCETSAKEGTNVVEAVLHLAREVKKHVKLRRQSGSQVKLSLSSGKKALNNCCGM